MSNKAKTAVLISGNGSNLQALIDAAQDADYPAEISLVISNKANAYGLERAKDAGIDTYVVNHKNYNSRAEFDEEMHKILIANDIEYVCLAGFMRLLSPEFTEKWAGKMINIHPSLLPKFKGANAIEDAFNAGEMETGCTTHYVIPEMDAGEVICQAKVSIEPSDTLETLADKIHKQEHLIFPESLKLIVN